MKNGINFEAASLIEEYEERAAGYEQEARDSWAEAKARDGLLEAHEVRTCQVQAAVSEGKALALRMVVIDLRYRLEDVAIEAAEQPDNVHSSAPYPAHR